MPLDNNAKISDVITSLEGMQGINQKAELASVIGAPATASDNIATQVTKLQSVKDALADKIGADRTDGLQEMVEGITLGKKWAGGTVRSGAGSLNFMSGSNQYLGMAYVDLPPLGFVPSKIELKGVTINGQQGGLTVYDKDGYFPLYPEVQIITCNTYFTSVNANNISFKMTSNAVVGADGSRLPVPIFEIPYTWKAYE